MNHRVRVLRRAQRDLLEIRVYLEKEAAADVAAATLDALLSAMDRLERFPQLGPRPRDARLRKLQFRYLIRADYLVFYKVLRAEVRVYRVLHQKRAYEPLL